MSKVHSIWDKKGETSSEKKHEMFTQDGATGGSATGVLRRVKGDGDGSEALKELMRTQQESGVVADGEMPAMIYIYKNGFTIGEDGELHDSSKPENVEFLQDLRRGVVPKKLETLVSEKFSSDVRSLGVHVINRETQEYEAPTPSKSAFSAFTGDGHSLKSASAAASETVAGELSAAVTARELPATPADPAAESIRVQLLLANGKRVALKIAAVTTVAELYGHAKAIGDISGGFSLMAGFPPAKLTDGSQTVKDAGLNGARVTQKAL